MRFPRDRGSGSVDFSSVSEQAVSRFSRSKKRSKKNSKQQPFKPAANNSALSVGKESLCMYACMYVCIYACGYFMYVVMYV